MMKALEIRLYGVVQGVGFRPFVVRLAKKRKLAGWVTNEGGGVHLVVKGPAEEVDGFLQELRLTKPGPSIILTAEVRSIAPEDVDVEDFSIKESAAREEDLVFLPPDMPLCPECLKEMRLKQDRRFLHPLISCMYCGPRYTIIDHIPYDRENTSMGEFPLCPVCCEEYEDIQRRRYHAQTVSCYHCGPVLSWRGKDAKAEQRGEEAFEQAVGALSEGKVIAVKGIGGYHLACSPYLTEAVSSLRDMKGREAKPFALLFPTLEAIEEYCEISPCGQKALLSPQRPIVLLPKRDRIRKREFSPLVAGKSPDYGVFLPYTPLQVLLLERTGPLIMTSANISEQPIIYDDGEMLAFSHPALAGVLYHDRKIRIGVDDSVVRCHKDSIQVIRRARGYVPLPVVLKKPVGSTQVLACGGLLKSTFCLVKKGFAFLSQHLGDLSEAAAWDAYLENVERLQRLLQVKPEVICCDLHPDYPTTRFALSLTGEPVRVQHHHAHIASVMAEEGLREEVLGVAFDGTGYGPDETIWGGEFLVCTPHEFRRVGHLRKIGLIGGDALAREVERTAAFYLAEAGREDFITTPDWPLLKQAKAAGQWTVETSSAGRLFDAVSAILGLSSKAGYEGEAAVLLEQAALSWLKKNRPEAAGMLPYRLEADNRLYVLDYLPLIGAVAEKKAAGLEAGQLAAGFHLSLAEAVVQLSRELCRRFNIKKMVLSGGVFQNRLLLETVISRLEKSSVKVYYNKVVPPNDGGISLGQAWVALHQNRW